MLIKYIGRILNRGELEGGFEVAEFHREVVEEVEVLFGGDFFAVSWEVCLDKHTVLGDLTDVFETFVGSQHLRADAEIKATIQCALEVLRRPRKPMHYDGVNFCGTACLEDVHDFGSGFDRVDRDDFAFYTS